MFLDGYLTFLQILNLRLFIYFILFFNFQCFCVFFVTVERVTPATVRRPMQQCYISVVSNIRIHSSGSPRHPKYKLSLENFKFKTVEIYAA